MTPHTATYNELISYTKWFTVVRYIASGGVAIIVVILWMNELLAFNPLILLYTFFPVYFLISGFFLLAATKKIVSPVILSYQLLLDIVSVTVGIYLSGGINSPFIFIYTGVLLAASIISPKQIIVTAVAIVVLFSSLLVGELTNIIPAMVPTETYGQDTTVRIIVFLLLSTIISFQGYYFITQIRKRDTLLSDFKEQLFFTTVHDLKSPLTAIGWTLERYEDSTKIAKDPKLKELIDTLQVLNGRMKKLLKSVMEIIKGQSDKFEIKKESVDITAVIEDILKEMKPLLLKHKISTTHDSKDVLKVLADPTLTKEILANLIDNAIKYNLKENGQISITHSRNGGFVKTQVKNSGKGISKKDQTKLFSLFYRGEAENSNISGTGIGLYLVKNLVEKMEGTISVDSEPGVSTTFTISLVQAPRKKSL